MQRIKQPQLGGPGGAGVIPPGQFAVPGDHADEPVVLRDEAFPRGSLSVRSALHQPRDVEVVGPIFLPHGLPAPIRSRAIPGPIRSVP